MDSEHFSFLWWRHRSTYVISICLYFQYKLSTTRWAIKISKSADFPCKLQARTAKDRWIRIWSQILVNLKATCYNLDILWRLFDVLIAHLVMFSLYGEYRQIVSLIWHMYRDDVITKTKNALKSVLRKLLTYFFLNPHNFLSSIWLSTVIMALSDHDSSPLTLPFSLRDVWKIDQ